MIDKMKKILLRQLILLMVFAFFINGILIFLCLKGGFSSFYDKATWILLVFSVLIFLKPIIDSLIDYRMLKNNTLNHFTGKTIKVNSYLFRGYPNFTYVFIDSKNNEYELSIDGFGHKEIPHDSEEEFTVYYTKTTKIGFIPELTTKE